MAEQTLKLSSPLQTHKGLVSELKLKEPTARSFVTHGEPFKIRVKDGLADFDFDNKAMSKFLSDMTGVDDIILFDLAATDYLELRSAAASLILGLSGENFTQKSDSPSAS